MVSKSQFSTYPGKILPETNTVNNAGGKAYEMSAKHQLAQYCITGCLGNTYYSSSETQLEKVLELCKKVELDFIAKTAAYCRKKGYMKDMPALLIAFLAVNNYEHLEFFFKKVIDNGKMLRNFVQIIRSGRLGRKSFGSRMKRLIQNWLNEASDEKLIQSYVGTPSLGDIIKMVHPKPKDAERMNFYGWMLGKVSLFEALPIEIQKLITFKGAHSREIPDVPFQMLTQLPLSETEWTQIALNSSWHTCRMNLNTFQRHGVLKGRDIIKKLADKLTDKEAIKKSRVFPYQLLTAYLNTEDVPPPLREALQDAMEIAIENVPQVDGEILIGVDVSGSMDSPVTGKRGTATSKVKCVQVASLIGSCLLRRNPKAGLVPFDTQIRKQLINPRDTVMTNAEKLAALCGGGTDCSLPLSLVVNQRMKVDLVIIISDNESWLNQKSSYNYEGGRSSVSMQLWSRIKKDNPGAQLICIDLTPNSHSQVAEREDIFNIGGFSDNIFDLISKISRKEATKDFFVNEIENFEPPIEGQLYALRKEKEIEDKLRYVGLA